MSSIIKKESKLEYIFYNDQVHIYKVRKLYGFNEILDDIKEKYSDKKVGNFNNSYFDHDIQKLKILDHELLGFDDFLVTSCVPKANADYYSKYTNYQIYTGKAQFITYPVIYKLLKENASIENIIKWYTSSNNKPLDESERNNILKLLLHYIKIDHVISIDMELLNKIKMENNNSLSYFDLDKYNNYLNENEVLNLIMNKLNLNNSKSIESRKRKIIGIY